MSHTIYASFLDPEHGKKAAGALLDHGVLKEDLSLLVHETYLKNNPNYWQQTDVVDVNNTPKTGITTTTGADAGEGAAKGGIAGFALGVLGLLAALTIPGFGLVIGGGALATAIGAAVGTTAAGAVAGGVTGYLKDQGMPEDSVQYYQEELNKGGSLLAVQVPSGKATQADVESLLAKYGASRTNAYGTAVRAL